MEDDPEARSLVLARVAAGDFAAILAWAERGRWRAHERRKRGADGQSSLPLRAPPPEVGGPVAVAAHAVLTQVSGAGGAEVA